EQTMNQNRKTFVFPPGYRFNPTDKELVLSYLTNKVNGMPLPTHIIDANVYQHHPDDLLKICNEQNGKREKAMYLFTQRDRKYANGTRPNRSTGNGFWKATGADKPIGHERNPIGYKKVLVYYERDSMNPTKSTKTNWIMHEY
ncbi:NAM domain-containing protein, partial [Cephalotus follicularis]